MKIKLFMASMVLLWSFSLLKAQEPQIIVDEIIINSGDSMEMTSQKHKIAESLLFMPRTAGEVFADLPGMSVMKRSNFSIEPIINGFKREQLNLMLDGGTQVTHSCANRMDAMTTRISSNEIDKIEIVKGPYNVRFGQTMGGVVNIITSDNRTSDELKISGNLQAAYELNGNGKTTGLALHATGQKFNVSVDGTLRDYDNYTAGNDQEILSSFTAYDYSAKAAFMPSKHHKMQVSFRHSLAFDVLHAGLPMDALDDDGKLIAFDYAYKNSGSFLAAVNAKFYGSLVDHLMTNEWRPNYKASHSLSPVSSRTMGGRTEFVLALADKITLYTGLDFKYINKDGQRERNVYINTCTGQVFDEPKLFIDLTWQNSETKDMGLFAETHWSISDKTKANFGIRGDYVQSEAKNLAEDFAAFYGTDVTPDAQMNVNVFGTVNQKLSNNLALEWSVGRGTRNPDLLELYINHYTVGQDRYEYLGNPNLKSEANLQTNLAVSGRFKSVKVHADVFYAYMTDYITAVVDTTIPRKFMPCMDPKFTKQFVNIDNALQYGANAGFNIDIYKGIFALADVTYTYGENSATGEALPEIAPFMSNIGIGYKSKKVQTQIKMRAAAEQSNVALTSGESVTPGYQVFDFLVMYSPLKSVQIAAGVDNLTNVTYYDHLSRPYVNQTEKLEFYEIGRNVKFSVKYLF